MHSKCTPSQLEVHSCNMSQPPVRQAALKQRNDFKSNPGIVRKRTAAGHTKVSGCPCASCAKLPMSMRKLEYDSRTVFTHLVKHGLNPRLNSAKNSEAVFDLVSRCNALLLSLDCTDETEIDDAGNDHHMVGSSDDFYLDLDLMESSESKEIDVDNEAVSDEEDFFEFPDDEEMTLSVDISQNVVQDICESNQVITLSAFKVHLKCTSNTVDYLYQHYCICNIVSALEVHLKCT